MGKDSGRGVRGLRAAWRIGEPGRTAETLASITAGLSVVRNQRTSHEADGVGGVGVVSRFNSQQICRTGLAVLACDTDLYNEDELRRAAGRGAETTAQLLAALYERHGAGFVEKLRGAFSVVLWDKGKENLIAAVDHFGQRRLVYHEDARGLLIASRIDALVRAGIQRDVNPRAIATRLNFSASLSPD